MKKCFLIVLTGLFVLAGCNNQPKPSGEKEPVQSADTLYDSTRSFDRESVLKVQNQEMLWQVNDSPSLKLHQPLKAGLDTMTVYHVLALINANEDSIHLEYLKTSHDTIFVHIPHAEYLTERIGSTGAEMFMASTTYSLTAIKGIQYVDYDFVEGDHAAPGVYDRSYFESLK